jgi:hypothetical protein
VEVTRNLTAEERALVERYIDARYAHWTHSQRRARRSGVLQRLKAASDERVERYFAEVHACFDRSHIR